MSEPRTRTPADPNKPRKPREAKVPTYGKTLGSLIDQFDSMPGEQRSKLLGTLNKHYGPNDAGA